MTNFMIGPPLKIGPNKKEKLDIPTSPFAIYPEEKLKLGHLLLFYLPEILVFSHRKIIFREGRKFYGRKSNFRLAKFIDMW